MNSVNNSLLLSLLLTGTMASIGCTDNPDDGVSPSEAVATPTATTVLASPTLGDETSTQGGASPTDTAPTSSEASGTPTPIDPSASPTTASVTGTPDGTPGATATPPQNTTSAPQSTPTPWVDTATPGSGTATPTPWVETSTPASGTATPTPWVDTTTPASGTATPTPWVDTTTPASGTATPTPWVDTATPASATATPTPWVETSTPASGTATPVQNTPSATLVPGTATPVQNTPSATLVPGTATPVQDTPSATLVPGTATPVRDTPTLIPPTHTPTPTTDADEDGYDAWQDCDDNNADIYPGAEEFCNDLDDDCDGEVDSPDPVDGNVYYEDTDGDGHGNPDAPITTCDDESPDGYVVSDDDCDDSNPEIYPGADETCTAGESCLNVLELGYAYGSDYYWIAPADKAAYEEYCDFGTVNDGWGWRQELNIQNPGDEDLVDHQVPILLDTAALIEGGQLQSGGQDLRIGTIDGPLLSYWYENPPGEGMTQIWVTVPALGANGQVELVLFFGNVDTERKSLAWLYEDFSLDRSANYLNVYEDGPDWGTPHWNWDPENARLATDNTNADYFLESLDLFMEQPAYIETYATSEDNDALGPMFRDTTGAIYAANVSNDYNGVDNNHTEEGIVKWDSVPTEHRQASTLLDVGNVGSVNDLNRLGLYYDGSAMSYHLNGEQMGSVDVADVTLDRAGLASMANSETGSLKASYYYVWVGAAPIDFNPLELESSAEHTTGEAESF